MKLFRPSRRRDAGAEDLRAKQTNTDRFAQVEFHDGHHLIGAFAAQNPPAMATINSTFQIKSTF